MGGDANMLTPELNRSRPQGGVNRGVSREREREREKKKLGISEKIVS